MDRSVAMLALVAACSAPTYKDGDDDASAIIARDGGLARAPDAATRADAAEPVAPSDAAVPSEAKVDGGQALAASLPDWARPLLGRYAGRSYSFAQDKAGTLIRVREYMRVDIVETRGDDAHVELQLQTCDSLGEGMTADTLVAKPELATLRVHRVLFGERSWATQARASADGFTRALPERCLGKEGEWVTKDPAQTWIAGAQCQCPSSIDVAPKLEDCRVIDQDRDGSPGSTVRILPKVLGLGEAQLFFATINQSTFVNGTVGSDGRHSAQLVVDQFGWQLGCAPACTDISATPAPCPPARSKLELVRAESSCAELIAQATTLFPTALPGYPGSCP